LYVSGSKAVDILEAYEGTLEDDYPPENERCEHGEMLLYKVTGNIDACFRIFYCSVLNFHLFEASAVTYTGTILLPDAHLGFCTWMVEISSNTHFFLYYCPNELECFWRCFFPGPY